MKQQAGAKVLVFVVWERVRFTDFGTPSTFTLKRVSDPRASQYWDKQRLVSRLLGESQSSAAVWDYIAIYPKGKLWEQSPPEPAYAHAPVIQGIDGAENVLKRILHAAIKSAAHTVGTMLETLNPNYPQEVGREELFERERGSDPDFAAWSSCVLVCDDAPDVYAEKA